MVWKAYEFQLETDALNRFLNSFRSVAKRLEASGLIVGFSFNLYSDDSHLTVRLDLTNPDYEKRIVETLHDLSVKPRPIEYSEKEGVARMYELGSRCVFLLHDLIEKGRVENGVWKTPLFQCALHGLCNSLGLSYPGEVALHFNTVMAIAETLKKQGRLSDNDLKDIKNALNECIVRINKACQ